LKIGELQRNHRIDQDETIFFKLTIDQGSYDKNKDLVVKVFSEGQYLGDPDVFISKVRIESRINWMQYRIIESRIE